jgi:hypothetical protein
LFINKNSFYFVVSKKSTIMTKSRFIVKWLKWIFNWAFYINIVLAGGAIGFQLINLVIPTKTLTIGYLGKFQIIDEQSGALKLHNAKVAPIVFHEISGSPLIYVPGIRQLIFVLIYSLMISALVIFVNYQLKELFRSLHQSISDGLPFNTEIPGRLRRMAIGFMAYFIGGTMLSLIKVFLIQEILTERMLLKPAFDNTVFSYLWISIFLFIMVEVFNAGLFLKRESELTI